MVITHEQVAAGEAKERIGGKAAGLGLLLREGLPVPPFFVLPADTEITRAELEAALEALGPGPYAVRSSALAEDGAQHSFAGQLDSVLGVRRITKIEAAIATCRASGSAERVLAYCANHGIEPGPVAVVVQRMIRGEASGVMFTRDPDRPEHCLISAAWGLGEGVVQGSADCDSFRVGPSGEIEAEVQRKQVYVRLVGEAPVEREVPRAKRDEPVLSEAQVRQLVTWGRRLEHIGGGPQDVEFTLEGEQLWLLQTRPVTTPVPFGRKLLWDNSNIVESYSGVTTPLTYSFARGAYNTVYRLFCQVMGVSRRTVLANDAIFQRLIGLIQGRVYYNLNAWFRIITLLPAYQYNRQAMQQMMGVSEVAADEDAEAPASAWQRNLVHKPRVAWLVLALLWRLVVLRRDVRRFQRDFEDAVGRHRKRDLGALPPEELVAIYGELQRRLLMRWTPPLVNDFFCMIFHSALRKQCSTLLCGGDEQKGAALANALLAGQGELESTAPTRALLERAARLRAAPWAVELFDSSASDSEVLEGSRRDPTFARWLDDWMERYGDRCIDELKLETVPLRDRPEFVIASLRNYLRGEAMDPSQFGVGERRRRQMAEQQARTQLSGWRRMFFLWVLSRARETVATREDLRFLRTRIFGLVRDIFRALGAHMAQAGALADPSDVFYLQIEELFGWVEGNTPCTTYAGLVALRREEFDGYRQLPGPPERFHTWGPVHRHNRFAGTPIRATTGDDGMLRGTPCYPGVVEGQAVVLRDPGGGARLDGDILVAPRTDPGWVPLFPSISGLLVERGSPLSHSAVVAREMGIPTVVGIRGLTSLIQDGQRLRMDGGAGTVKPLPPRAPLGDAIGDDSAQPPPAGDEA
jgi:phosphohistidine swiveling domain-containing protein